MVYGLWFLWFIFYTMKDLIWTLDATKSLLELLKYNPQLFGFLWFGKINVEDYEDEYICVTKLLIGRVCPHSVCPNF